MKALLPRLQTLANVAGLALLLWLAAPLLVVRGEHPFDGAGTRAAGLLVLALVALLVWGAWQWRRRRRNARLFAQLQDADAAAASEALSQRFTSAMALLRSGITVEGSGKGRLWRRRRQVYELPWYVFIGAPGAGKTTALLHSGLRFPLAERLGAAPVAGIGGTRQCDWWFTDRAVFLDTAGRYTTQDSHVGSDSREWQLFLRLLRRYRPVQPINGVIVTVSVPDLLQGGAELEQQAAAVEARLLELRAELGLSFPVYLLVTKLDLLAGFVEFFGDFDAAQREQLWGVTFEHPPAAGAAALPQDLGARLAALPARIEALTVLRMQQEPLPQRRAAIFHYAAQVEALLPALESFARRAFRRSAETPRQLVRGIYLSSGTQEGNPIDRVLGELARSYRLAVRTLPRPDGGGKAYFLSALLQKLVITEAPLAGTNLKRRQRRRWFTAAAGSALAGLFVLACVGWWYSYRANLDYVASVRERVDKVARQIDPKKSGRLDQLLPLYATLNNLASSDGVDPAKAPLGFGFGLFQGPRLAQSASQTYHRVLDRTLAPLLAQRLSEALKREDDPAARYEALRVGMMLVTPGRLQRAEVRRWAAQAFADVPGRNGKAAEGQAPGAGEQQEWLRHLDALLERNAVLDAVRLDPAALRAARAALNAVPIDQRVYERLLARTRAQDAGDKTLAELASPGAVVAFAPADAASGIPAIPSVYTRQVWRELMEPGVDPTIAEMADEAGWVLNDRSAATQRLMRDAAARDELAQKVGQRHAQATIEQWDKLLASLALQAPTDGDALARLSSSLAATNSPLRELLRRIALEFPAAPAQPGGRPAAQAYEKTLAEHFGSLGDYARGPGGAAIDKLIVPVADTLRDPAGGRAGELGRELRAEAGRAPAPLKDIWSGLAESLAALQRKALDKQMSGGIAEVSQACRRLVADRFPFAPDAKRDMPYADFARLFGTRGVLDTFFRTYLAPQVDTQSRPWKLTGAGGGYAPEKAQGALRSFEMAEDIRRVFFPAGAELPQLRLRLTPVGMDDSLLQFSADVDGQLLRYENGPSRAKPLVWPGPAAQQRVLLRILPAGPSGVGAEVHEGPWALLRVLQRHGWQRGSGGSAAPVAKIDVDGRSLSLEVATDPAPGANLIAELPSFRCPDAW